MKKGKLISFAKYFQPMERAKARAADLAGRMKRQMEGSVVPPEIDPYKGNLQDEMTRILYESELLADRHRAGSDAGGGDR